MPPFDARFLDAGARPGTSLTRLLLNKVPQVTLWFWIIKVMATTVGETGADLITVNLNMGLAFTSVVASLAVLAVLAVQVATTRYQAPLYWLTVVLISVVGTLVSDNLVDGMGVSLVTTSIAFAIILTVVFVSWYASERTLSIHTIVTRKRELFYWGAILFTFALGTSVGDLFAERLDLGYWQAALVFAAAIGVVAAAYYLAGMNEVLCFWAAYVLTRPLGASVGDWLSKPRIADGLGLGTVNTSIVFFGIITAVVAYLAATGADRLERADAPPARP